MAVKHTTRKPPRFYCPACGEVRTLDRIRDRRILAHWTGSPYAPPTFGQRRCPGGQPDPEKDVFR